MRSPEKAAKATIDPHNPTFFCRVINLGLNSFRCRSTLPNRVAGHYRETGAGWRSPLPPRPGQPHVVEHLGGIRPLSRSGRQPRPRRVATEPLRRQRFAALKAVCRQAAVLSLACVQACLAQAQAAPLAPAQLRKPFDPAIEQVAQKNGIDANLLRAIINVESGFRPAAYHGGAVGLMQVKPSTAHHFGIQNVRDPVKNIEAGGRYLRHLLDMFNNNMRLAIAAYNAGEGTILRRNHHIPAMTHTYVAKVMTFWHSYQQLY